MPDTGRMYLCARCREQVVVCRRCDRGQVYCPSGCAALARRERQRAAAARYQSSRRGRFGHAERSRRYRRRVRGEIVTHQGSVALLAGDLLRIEATVPVIYATVVIDSIDEVHTEPAAEVGTVEPSVASPSCKHCGARCPGGLRFGFVRHRPWNPGLADRSARHCLSPPDDPWP